MKTHVNQVSIYLFIIALLSFPALSFSQDSVSGDIAELNKIHVSLTEGNRMREKVVKGWLKNKFSGYPDLVTVLLSTVKCPPAGCNVKGPMLPLDVIERWCKQNRGDVNKVIMDHNADEVKQAYLMTWYERIGNESGELTIEQILSGQ